MSVRVSEHECARASATKGGARFEEVDMKMVAVVDGARKNV